MFPDLLGHLLVKASEEYGADHDRDVHPESREEPGALQRDVRRTDTQRLTRTVRQGK